MKQQSHKNFFPCILLTPSFCTYKKRQSTWYSDLVNMAFWHKWACCLSWNAITLHSFTHSSIYLFIPETSEWYKQIHLLYIPYIPYSGRCWTNMSKSRLNMKNVWWLMSNLFNIHPSDILRMCFLIDRATVQCRYFDHMINWCRLKHKTNTQTVIDSDSENASQDTYLTGNDINMYRNRLI